MDKKTVSIFGATGSIGQSTRDVIQATPERFDVKTVTANKNVKKLAETAVALNAKCAIAMNENGYEALKEALSGTNIQAAAGPQALKEAAKEKVDIHVAAIVGMAGLEPLFEALEYADTVAIANKEPLVAAGPFVMEKAAKHETRILPLDSEHNAIFQVFENENRSAVRRLILTASGGPFLNWSPAEMAVATPDQAIAHPNWAMGAKISVDSATMMNKALEIIEARYLFDMPDNKIDVIIHPQSIVHSMVEYSDGSVLAQLGASDMRTAITYALNWPERGETPGEKLNLESLSQLDFMAPDFQKFPALKLAKDCLKHGAKACITMNAANEIAVAAFLDYQIAFSDIYSVIESALHGISQKEINSLESVIALDKEVREKTQSAIVVLNQKRKSKTS